MKAVSPYGTDHAGTRSSLQFQGGLFDHKSSSHFVAWLDEYHRRSAPTQRPAALLACHGLRHREDGRLVLDDVSFEVRENESFGLTGSDPAGLHTVVRMICGILPTEPGAVVLGPQLGDGAAARSLSSAVGYVAQDCAVTPTLTVAATVRFWARLAGLHEAAGRERTEEVLHLARIEQYGDRLVARCTAEVLRAMSLAVALLRRPRLLVVDEPGRGLNPDGRDWLTQTIELVRGPGAVIYAARRSADVRSICNRVGVLENARLLITTGRTGQLTNTA